MAETRLSPLLEDELKFTAFFLGLLVNSGKWNSSRVRYVVDYSQAPRGRQDSSAVSTQRWTTQNICGPHQVDTTLFL